MPAASERPRLVLFGLLAAALLLAGFALSSGTEIPSHTASSGSPRRALISSALPDPRAASDSGLRRSAARFLNAFFAYEVGDSDLDIRHRLAASATSAFAAELLRRPPRPPGRLPPAARLQRLSTRITSADPPRALVSGSARRGAAAEQFSFLFALTASGWRAVGPAE
jgi:hypothetical protein